MVSTHLKNISQIVSLPQIGVKIKNIWNHHPVTLLPWATGIINGGIFGYPTHLKDIIQLHARWSACPGNQGIWHLPYIPHGRNGIFGLHLPLKKQLNVGKFHHIMPTGHSSWLSMICFDTMLARFCELRKGDDGWQKIFKQNTPQPKWWEKKQLTSSDCCLGASSTCNHSKLSIWIKWWLFNKKGPNHSCYMFNFSDAVTVYLWWFYT